MKVTLIKIKKMNKIMMTMSKIFSMKIVQEDPKDIVKLKDNQLVQERDPQTLTIIKELHLLI